MAGIIPDSLILSMLTEPQSYDHGSVGGIEGEENVANSFPLM